MLNIILHTLNTEDFSSDISLLVLYAFYMGRVYAVADYLEGSDCWDTVLYGHEKDPDDPHTMAYALEMREYIEELWQERHPAKRSAK